MAGELAKPVKQDLSFLSGIETLRGFSSFGERFLYEPEERHL